MTKNILKLICIIFLVSPIIIYSVNSYNFVEDFDSIIANYDYETFDILYENLTTDKYISSDQVIGDSCRWNLFQVKPSTVNVNDRYLNFSDLDNIGTSQFQSNNNGISQSYILLCKLDEGIIITNSSYIKVKARGNYTSATTRPTMDILFMNNDNLVNIYLQQNIFYSATPNVYSEWIFPQNNNTVTSSHQLLMWTEERFSNTTTYTTYQKSFYEMNKTGGRHGLNQSETVNYIGLIPVLRSSGNRRIMIDYFELGNVTIPSQNAIPTANFSINPNRVCINDSQSTTVSLNYSVNDEEGDTIYYATNVNKIENEYTQKFTIQECPYLVDGFFCTDFPNLFGIGAKTLFTSDTCTIGSTPLIKVDNHNLVELTNGEFITTFFYNVFNGVGAYVNYDATYMFQLNGMCDGVDKSWHYRLNLPTTQLQYNTILQGLTYENDTVNISFSNNNLISPDNELVKVGVLRQNNSMHFYNHRINETILIGNYSIDTMFYMNFTIDVGERKFNLSIFDIETYTPVISSNELDTYRNNNSTDEISIVSYTPSNITVAGIPFINYFYYGSQPNFSTTPIISLTLSQTGTQAVNFFVTDSVHVDLNQYNKYTESVTVYDCQYFVEHDKTTEGEVIKSVNNAICQPLDNVLYKILYGSEFDQYKNKWYAFSFCNLIKYIWGIITILLFIAIAIIVGFADKPLALPLSLFWATLNILWSNIFISWGAGINVLMGILFALSVAMMIRRFVIGGGVPNE